MPHLIIQLGPCVDKYLEAEGALAQAVNRNTIRLSSKISKLSPFHQRLIFLHELAHLKQLASPGGDSVRALEAEAWEAAHAWMNGRYYRIRGRARTTLNAIAIIQGGAKGHPHAPIWYTKSPVEPIGNKSTLTVKEVAIQDPMSLSTVLDQMIAAKGEKEFVLVSHGDGNGLSLALQKGSTAGAEKVVIVALSADRPGKEVGFDGTEIATPTKSDEDVAILTRLSTPQVAALRAKMNLVRGMQLKHIAFRACNMGISLDTMEAFRNFFGAASISAPVEFDSYGKFAPIIGGNVEAWATARRKNGYHISIDGGVACGTKDTDSSLVYTILAAASSKDAFRAWVKKHILEGGWGPNGVIYHGVKVRHALSANSPSVYFVRDTEFIDGLVYFKGK